MKSMQRKFGGMMSAKTGDEADVGLILQDFKTTDEMLSRLIGELNTFRNAWQTIISGQSNIASTLATLYDPVTCTGDGEQLHVPAETPDKYLHKCHLLSETYANEQIDLAQEIGMLTDKLVGRAEEAKLHASPLKRTMKYRENMKMDYERLLAKAESARRKETRDQKGEIALARLESELAQAKINYNTADDHVRENFPPVVEAISSLLPYLRTTMIMLQTTLCGQLYTVLDGYTRQLGLSNPAPNDAQIVATFESEFTSLRKELENGLQILTHGKTIHMPMTVAEKPTATAAAAAGVGSFRNKLTGRKPEQPLALTAPPVRPTRPTEQTLALPAAPSSRPASLTNRSAAEQTLALPAPPVSRPALGSRQSSSIHADEEVAPAKPPRPNAAPAANLQPSWNTRPVSNGAALTAQWQQRTPSFNQAQAAAGALSPLISSPGSVSASAGYFENRRQPDQANLASAAVAAVAMKKKPPPPVPAKRMPSATAQLVTALYDFEAQNKGDLPFREGDRIRVVKKTDSTDDWWQGELNGITGSFPANYVQL